MRISPDLEIVTNEPAERIELIHRNIPKFGTITNTLARVRGDRNDRGAPSAAPAGTTT